MANEICTRPSASRPPHLPRTIPPRSIGVDARRRSSPCFRSMTRVTAPLVSNTIIVNITMVPGIACSKPVGLKGDKAARWITDGVSVLEAETNQ